MLNKLLELLLSATKILRKEMVELPTKTKKKDKKFTTLKKLTTLLLP